MSVIRVIFIILKFERNDGFTGEQRKGSCAHCQAQTSTNRDQATIYDSTEYCKIKITAIVNANLNTEELRNDQDLGKANDIFWPNKLVGRPVQVAAVSQPLTTDLNQTPTSQPQIPTAEDLKSEDHIINYALQVMQMDTLYAT